MKKKPLKCHNCYQEIGFIEEGPRIRAAWSFVCDKCRKRISLCFKCCECSDAKDPEEIHDREFHYSVSLV